MRLCSTTISNFKGIEKCEIQFKPGFNLIKGENGKGKTSILEAIAVGLGGFIAGMDGVTTRHISKEEIRTSYVTLGDASCDMTTHVPTEIGISAEIQNESFEWVRSRKSINASKSTIQPRDIVRKAEEMSNDVNSSLPIILYQGAGRVWSQKREKTENPFKTKYVRAVGYMDALSDASNIKLLQSWCIKMEMQYMKTQSKIAEYEAVKRTVAGFMNKMENGREHEMFFDPTSQAIMYRTNNKVLPVTSLSAGYQSLIWMVFDIAYRMAILNPSKYERINETAGIVLIDELDMHLHPMWQWNVIKALSESFPNVQFICSTHAPILFVSSPNVWLIDIEGDEMTYQWSHYGLDINESLKNFQDVYNRPLDVQKEIDLFYVKLDAEEYDEAEQILLKLEKDTAPEHPALVSMRTRLELEKTPLED